MQKQERYSIIDSYCKARNTRAWSKSSANKSGWLVNGVGSQIKGTKTIRFINKRNVPSNRMKDVRYGQSVCCIRPEKAKIHQTWFVVGGKKSITQAK